MTTKKRKKKMVSPSVPWEKVRHANLQNWKVAREYLRLGLQEGGLDEFLEALRDIAKAIGVAKLAKRSNLTRQAVYKIVSEKGNPQARSLWQLMEALNLRFDLISDEHQKKAA